MERNCGHVICLCFFCRFGLSFFQVNASIVICLSHPELICLDWMRSAADVESPATSSRELHTMSEPQADNSAAAAPASTQQPSRPTESHVVCKVETTTCGDPSPPAPVVVATDPSLAPGQHPASTAAAASSKAVAAVAASSPTAAETPISPGEVAMSPHTFSVAVEAQNRLSHRLHHIFFAVSIALFVLCGITAVVLYLTKTVEASKTSLAVAGLCAFNSVILTGFLMYMHLCFYSNQYEQRFICRILLLVPIYAIDSFVGLAAHDYATVINVVRDTYEAYVIYMFFKLLMSYCGGEDQVVVKWQALDPPTLHHPPPLCCLKPLQLTERVLNLWKALLLQYMILNPLLTIITLPLIFTHIYHDGDVASFKNAFGYIAGVRFISVSLAFTSLVYFFLSTKNLIAEKKPLAKFAAIKAVVFLSFWQTVLLAVLNHFHLIPSSQLWTADQVETGLGNFVLCVEMYLMSLAHRSVFDYHPYMLENCNAKIDFNKLKHVINVDDIIHDTKQVIVVGGKHRKEGEGSPRNSAQSSVTPAVPAVDTTVGDSKAAPLLS